MKKCSKCGLTKELDDFYFRKGVNDNRESQCKKCSNKRNRKWEKNNPEKAKKIHSKHRRKNQLKYNKYSKIFVKKHKFRRCSYSANTRSIKKSNGKRITPQQLWSLAKKQKLK